MHSAAILDDEAIERFRIDSRTIVTEKYFSNFQIEVGLSFADVASSYDGGISN